MNGGTAGNLLLVEDEHRLRNLVAQFLRNEGTRSSRPATARTGSSGFAIRVRSTWCSST